MSALLLMETPLITAHVFHKHKRAIWQIRREFKRRKVSGTLGRGKRGPSVKKGEYYDTALI